MQNPLEGRAGEIASCREMAGGDDIGRKQRFREMTENILGRVRYLGKNDDIMRYLGKNDDIIAKILGYLGRMWRIMYAFSEKVPIRRALCYPYTAALFSIVHRLVMPVGKK